MVSPWTVFSAANFEFNPGTLDAVAGQPHGVEVIVVAALSVIVCALLIFLYRFYREARKYDLLRDESIKELTEAVQKYTAAADQRFEKIADSLDRLEDDFGEGIEKLSEKVEEHGERLDKIDDKLEEHDGLISGSTGWRFPAPGYAVARAGAEANEPTPNIANPGSGAAKPVPVEEPAKTKKRKNRK
ncbi:MAG: hypothetical protein K6E55_10665 [Thermoguttaceae bacterium]|nr:hypothetical protein [Thermoguttaceae bacterium]